MSFIEKKIAEKYNAEHPQQEQQPQQQQQPAAPAQPQPQQQQPAPQEEHHHGSGIAKKLGNAALFGAGATAGSDAVNGLINNA